VVTTDVVEVPPDGSRRSRPAVGGRIEAGIEITMILIGLAIFGFVLPHYLVADAWIRFTNLRALSHGHLVAGPYSLVGPVFASPLVALGKATGHEFGVVEMYNTAVFAIGIGAFALLLRGWLAPALLRRFLLLLVAGSMFAAHVVHWNSEVFTAMAVGVGLTAVAVRRFARVGWIVVILGVVNTPATLLALGLVVARRIWETRTLRYALIPLAAAGLIGLEHWLRNGSPFTSGYSDAKSIRTLMPYTGTNGFSYPFFFGLMSQCLSFGKGLLFFAPGLILPVRRTMREIPLTATTTLYRLYVWWSLFVAGLVLVYSPWWSWYGGFTWGPRFLLFASVPAALAIAVRLGDLDTALWVRLLTLAALALSIWVGLVGSVFMRAAFPDACTTQNFAFEAFCHYTPDYSVLWFPLVAHLRVGLGSWVVIAYFVAVFGWLAWPLCRSIGTELIARLRAAAPGQLRGWRI
jgi:hypothetical protein